MITNIELTNFQSHKNLSLDIGKLTMLTGGSNSGKSAVLRALIAMLTNESVSDYVTHGEKTLTVKVTYDDGWYVRWRKGNGVNEYMLGHVDSENAALFEKVGSEVPEQVATQLGIAPIVLEDGKKAHVNVHPQLDSPFLINETPGFVAKIFGELTSASKLFSAVSEGNRRTRASGGLRKTRRGDYEGLLADLSLYKDVDEQQKLYTEANNLVGSVAQQGSEIQNVEGLVKRAQHEQEELDKSEKASRVITPMALYSLEGLIATNKCISGAMNILSDHCVTTSKIEKMKKLEPTLQACAKVEGLDEILSIEKQMESCFSLWHQYQTKKSDIAETAKHCGFFTDEISKIDTQIDEAYQQLENCPSCGQELGQDAKSHLLGEQLV
jgi:energy-coupling factor transporter ATP-binding protein EcfA2